jgi:toxin HigB-1
MPTWSVPGEDTAVIIRDVRMTRHAHKQFEKLPVHLQNKVLAWIAEVAERGLREVQRSVGLHDEPLKGQRKGERSVRLNRHWRLIYVLRENDTPHIVEIQEFIPHAY